MEKITIYRGMGGREGGREGGRARSTGGATHFVVE
jgi:hypothetical protein